MKNNAIILGVDPGLSSTGWGVIENQGNRDEHMDNGAVITDSNLTIGFRLEKIFNELNKMIKFFKPSYLAVENIFININPESSIKLAQARGIIFLSAAINKIEINEYSPNQVKKNLVGYGHATKIQINEMLKRLFPGINIYNNDSGDALAVAICHSMRLNFNKKVNFKK
ncbi:MAG: crossover junction endodeoxyribonuclease RuvC [Rickettsiales bacterium]|nr:crossover junction endodeoxyribonuclease RuvC [Rickettsiales bacterium]OUV52991.1 MAG: crossover junction endodeoxyribonuclease RuvC [Rickettsiales bacterium TMED127]|tara:strand:- start:89992 stop:90498 length:507 start_codon:yes stop_codon:yes gene_type:complete